MANYKINGFDLLTAIGIIPDADKTTADSFEAPPEPYAAFSHDWGDMVEFDLVSATRLKPRVFTIKGALFAHTLSEYEASKTLLTSILNQNYVTLEQVESSVKVNAKLKSDGTSWKRITNLYDERILVAVQFQFDEVKQSMPYKINGGNYLSIVYYGAAAAVPSNSSQVLALPNNEIISVDNFTLNTGTTYTNFVFALPVNKGVVSITDLANGVGLNYSSTPITVDGKSYNLFYLSQGVPFSSNHPHKIIIQNV
jgi:hypothetical protein